MTITSSHHPAARSQTRFAKSLPSIRSTASLPGSPNCTYLPYHISGENHKNVVLQDRAGYILYSMETSVPPTDPAMPSSMSDSPLSNPSEYRFHQYPYSPASPFSTSSTSSLTDIPPTNVYRYDAQGTRSLVTVFKWKFPGFTMMTSEDGDESQMTRMDSVFQQKNWPSK